MIATAIPHLDLEQMDKMLRDETRELANKAKSVLGYKPMAETYGGTTLLAKLIERGITPLVRTKVEKYKASKVSTTMRRSTLELLAIALLTAVPLGCVIAFDVSCYREYDKIMPGFFEFAAPFVLSLASIGWVIKVLDWIFDPSSYRRTPKFITTWVAYPIRDYRGSVPAHVLSKAVQIKDAMPDVSLQIEQLVTITDLVDQRRVQDMRDAAIRRKDPFLVAIRENERYYIDVWDEEPYEKFAA